jgi:Tol biopolymer transport system component
MMPGKTILARSRIPATALIAVAAIILTVAALAACASPQMATIVIVADGAEQTLTTTAATVNQAIKESGVSLGPLDRISPPSWSEITPGLRIAVVRVSEQLAAETQPVPYSRKIIRDEALPAGESRLLQAGKEGVEEFTYRIISEDGVEVSRALIKRTTTTAPVDEILVVGSKGSLPPVDFTGALAYVSNGNAWIMRENSSGRRPLTSEGGLDGHVFSLSRDGRALLFSQASVVKDSPVFNSLWTITTTVKGEVPISLGIENVLWAQWSPTGDAIAFSTGERAAGALGWKAYNDLWIASAPAFTPTQVLSPTANVYYSWWGTTYTWAPDGESMAYANAGEVGVVDIATGSRRTLVQFPPFDSHSAWVWVPGISWSPDSTFLATVVHGHTGEGAPEESPLFDLWVLSADGSLVLPMARDVGMWSAPVWSPPREPGAFDSRILFGAAESPNHSQLSLYELHVMDQDGSNRRKVFPPAAQRAAETVDVAWSPTGDAVALVFQGDLHMLRVDSGQLHQLTTDGNSSHPQWAR